MNLILHISDKKGIYYAIDQLIVPMLGSPPFKIFVHSQIFATVFFRCKRLFIHTYSIIKVHTIYCSWNSHINKIVKTDIVPSRFNILNFWHIVWYDPKMIIWNLTVCFFLKKLTKLFQWNSSFCLLFIPFINLRIQRFLHIKVKTIWNHNKKIILCIFLFLAYQI